MYRSQVDLWEYRYFTYTLCVLKILNVMLRGPLQPRSLENFLDLGVLSKMEIEHKYLTDFTMHLYDDDKGVKPVKSWKFYEREDPTPDTPLVSFEADYFQCRLAAHTEFIGQLGAYAYEPD